MLVKINDMWLLKTEGNKLHTGNNITLIIASAKQRLNIRKGKDLCWLFKINKLDNNQF